jgi:uncharacterized protein (TIGR03435 family)
MSVRVFAPLLLICVAGVAASQTPEFEAASAKPNHCGTSPAGMRLSGSQLTIANVPLQRIAGAAFSIGEDRIDSLLTGPDWMLTECYDITAKLPPGAAMAQLPPMLQALLKARFGMTFHRETREVPAYALIMAKSGLKAQPAKPEGRTGFRIRPGHIESESATMAGLTDKLSRLADRPVVDKTSLTGKYEFRFDWAPDPTLSDANSNASLYTAIQEQLGLRLEAQKEPMEVIVLDQISKLPTGN